VFSELCFRCVLNFRRILNDDDNNYGSIITRYTLLTKKKANRVYLCNTEEAKKSCMGSVYRPAG